MPRALEVSAYNRQPIKYTAITTLTDEMVLYTSHCYILIPTFLSDAFPAKGASPRSCNSCPFFTYTLMLVRTVERSTLLQLYVLNFAIGDLIKSTTDR